MSKAVEKVNKSCTLAISLFNLWSLHLFSSPHHCPQRKRKCISFQTLMAMKKNWYDNCLASRGYRQFLKFWELSTQHFFLAKMQIVVPSLQSTVFHPLISPTWSFPYDKMSLRWLYNKVCSATNRCASPRIST